MLSNASEVSGARASSTATAAPAPTIQDQQAWNNCVSYAETTQQDLTFSGYANERILDVPGQGRSIVAPVATVSGVVDMYANFTCQIDGSVNSTVLSGSLSDAH